MVGCWKRGVEGMYEKGKVYICMEMECNVKYLCMQGFGEMNEVGFRFGVI